MIKHFDLKLNYRFGEKLAIENIAIGDLQNTVIRLLDSNSCLGGEITPTNLNEGFYLGGKQ